jgi:hypothetical protein
VREDDDRERQKKLAQEIVRRLDREGELRSLARGFDAVLKFRAGRWLLGRAGIDTGNLRALIEETNRLPDEMARHVLLFAPLGWAPSELAPHEAYVNASKVYQATQDPDAAEEVLVEGWNESDHMRLFIKRIYGFAHSFEPLRIIFFRRGQLIEKALDHHIDGRFEASVPIVLAQIDGIVLDVTGKSFFKRGDKAHLRDDSTIAGVPDGLELVAAVFSHTVPETVATGELQRHGVLHGRELGYDTRKNSTKAFVALLAVLEWARPLADSKAEESRRNHEELFAGSKERDPQGRWLDRRGFEEAKETLEAIEWLQANHYQQNGTYGGQIAALVTAEMRELWLPNGSPDAALFVSTDGSEYWATVQTPSGLQLGIAAVAGGSQTWLFADEVLPTGGPSSDERWKDPALAPPPDWDWEQEA